MLNKQAEAEQRAGGPGSKAAAGAGSAKLYEQMAADLEDMIRRSLLGPGDRLPSVRFLSRSRGVSISTVVQACYLLEARGLIRSRERSGWFVNGAPLSRPPQPDAISSPPTEARTPDTGQLIFSILQGVRKRDSAGLGSPFPSPSLFPLGRLSQALSRAGRNMQPHQVHDDLTPGNARLIPLWRAKA